MRTLNSVIVPFCLIAIIVILGIIAFNTMAPQTDAYQAAKDFTDRVDLGHG